MSSVEILNFLKRNIGIIIKRLEETGVIVLPAASDHTFYPELEVDENGRAVPVNAFLSSIEVDKDSQPVKVNFDRPVTDYEYTIVWPGTIKKVARFTSTLYLKAPKGHTSKVRLEVLR